MVKVALDAMGGDLGAKAVVAGVNLYVSQHEAEEVFFDFFGDKALIEQLLSQYPLIKNDSYRIYNTSDRVIAADMKPSLSIKNGKGTSMFEAILHVANRNADAVVSSGNTGAYMSLSRVLLKMIDGIDRPAIIGVLPAIGGRCVMLDLGANSECLAKNLIQFAIMGAASAKILLGIKEPTVGLLNIGTEKGKGRAALNEAFEFLEHCAGINFFGFVEGADIAQKKVDVVVADGFSGNIALKTMEGTVRYIMHLLKNEIKKSFFGKLWYSLCPGVFSNVRKAVDPRYFNGASFVGLSSVAVKSHGVSDAVGFANAISVAIELTRSNFVGNVKNEISLLELKNKNDNNNS